MKYLLDFHIVPNLLFLFFFFFNDTATTEIYTLSLHDALPIFGTDPELRYKRAVRLSTIPYFAGGILMCRSEEHTSELQSQSNLVCRLLLEKKKTKINNYFIYITSQLADEIVSSNYLQSRATD